MTIKILCDTSADLVLNPNKPLYDSLDIGILPMKVFFDKNDTFLEQKNISNIQFYELIKLSQTQPKTSPPAADDIFKEFQRYGKEYDELISLHISKDLSHTYINAVEAKKRYLKTESNPARINIIHSGVASLPLGKLVLKAVELKNKGYEVSEIIKQLYSWKENSVKSAFTVKDLNWLYEGGRLTRSQKTIGTILNKKPVLTFNHGKINVIGYSTGLERTLRFMVKYLISKMEEEKMNKLTMSFITAHNFGLIDDFSRVIKKEFPKINLGPKFELGATITSHTGMETIGFVISRDLKLDTLIK
ncbi:MAG: DegV family protein [Candidatus Heimdallarchaeaceae archaeon]